MRTALGTITAACVAALGFFPLIAGDHATQSLRGEWLSGTTIALGIGVILAIMWRQYPALWPARTARAFGDAVSHHEAQAVGIVALAALVLYTTIATLIFARRPILIDELVLLRQAQIFATGRLWLPANSHPEFYSILQMVTSHGRVYSQYPPGGPAMLTPFVLAHASWLAGPVFGAASVLAFAAFLRAAEPDARVRLGATVLFACAPFVAFMSGTHMSCVPTLTWLLAASAAFAHAARAEAPRPWLAFGGGLALGIAATIRPADALAFAIPAGLWSLRRPLHAVAALAGIAVPAGLMMYVNAHTTGAPLLFGYGVYWGAGNDLGFHPSPLGGMHTPAEGVAFIATYLLQLNRYLFETPFPSLLPAIAALALVPRIGAADRFLIAAAALLAGLYAAYWAEGFFLGPRYFFTLAPFFALWAARLPTLIGSFPTFVSRTIAGTLAAGVAIAAVVGIPTRAEQWASSFATERWAQPDVARRAGVHDALVFVRDGWEAQLVARLWALDIQQTLVERLVRTVDACRLDSALTALESTRAARPDLALTPLVRDSALVRRVVVGPGATIRMQTGSVYPARCASQVALAERGVTPLAPLSVLADGNVYVRDFGPRDSILVAAYPGRSVFTLSPASRAADALPRFTPEP